MLQKIMGHDKQHNCEICLKHSPHTNSLAILQEISISSGSKKDAPTKIRVKLQKDFLQPGPGEYILQERLINRFPYWQNNALSYIIWYYNFEDRWVISHSKDIGTSTWIFAGPIGSNKWPNEIIFKGIVLRQDICHPVAA